MKRYCENGGCGRKAAFVVETLTADRPLMDPYKIEISLCVFCHSAFATGRATERDTRKDKP